jgi:hypothetical protein
MKRLGAWAELDKIAKSETDPQIRRIAEQAASRPFEVRKSNFLRHVPRLSFKPNQSRLVISSEVDVRMGKPAKPLSLIRAVLERIHQLVTGWAR